MTKPKPMSAAEFAKSLATLELTQRAAGPLLGVDERTIARWFHGHIQVPLSVTYLLRVIISSGTTFEAVTKIPSYPPRA